MSERFRRRALGEAGLIVMSVFLALVAENAWSSRGDRRLARGYLDDLSSDLAVDTVLHRLWVDIADRQASAATALLADLDAGSPSMTPAATAVALYHASRALQFELGSPTYRDLVASGNMRLMPETVRSELVRYETYLTRTNAHLGVRPNPFAGLGVVPGSMAEVLEQCFSSCRELRFTATDSDLLSRADSVLATLEESRQRGLMSWRSIPNVAGLLDEALRQSLWFVRKQGEVSSRLSLALAAVGHARNE